MVALPSLLQPAIVNDRISRLKVTNNVLQRAFGMQAGGPSVKRTPSRRGMYDIYNDSREVASASAPGTEALTRARFPIGQVAFSIPRHAEKIPILLEEVNQMRPIGGPVSSIDELGEQYIISQEANQKKTLTALREFQIAAMLRGSYTWTASGRGYNNTFSGGSVTINFQIPSGNKTQLDMLGGGSIIGTTWSNAAAPIIRDCLQVNQAFIESIGKGLKEIWVNSTVWGYIITNTEVQNLAGSVNNPIRSMNRNEDETFVAVLEALPWVTFHICDEVLSVAGTNTRVIPDTAAVFLPEMDGWVCEYMECPEPVVDPMTKKVVNQYGEYFYYDVKSDPVSWELHSRHNGLPILKVPAAVAFGTVVF